MFHTAVLEESCRFIASNALLSLYQYYIMSYVRYSDSDCRFSFRIKFQFPK